MTPLFVFYMNSTNKISQTDQTHIKSYIIFQDQPFTSTVLRDICNAVSDCITWRFDIDRFTVKKNLSTTFFICTENCFHKFCTTGTYQSCKTDNLSIPCFKTCIFKQFNMWQIFCFQRYFADFVLIFGVKAVQLTTNHQADQMVFIYICCFQISNHLSISENYNTVCNRIKFFQSMWNIYNSNIFFLKKTDNTKQNLYFTLWKRGCWFIHNYYFCLCRYCFDDLNQLLHAHRQISYHFICF